MHTAATYTDEIAAAICMQQASWSVEASAAGNVISGHVHLDGEDVGSFMRVVDGRAIHHIDLGLIPGAQRKGFARLWIAHCMDAYASLGIERVVVHAQRSGSVVWHHMGFTVDEAEWHRMLTVLARHRRSQLKAGSIDAAEHTAFAKRLKALRVQRPSLASLDRMEWSPGAGSALANLSWCGFMNIEAAANSQAA